MPHKHKRRQKDNPDNYDLPPTKVAKPLPTKESESIFTSKKPKQKKSQPAFKDDTPKAFARMMQQLQKASSTGSGAIPRTPSGLDDGTRPTKQNRKRKRGEQDASNPQERNNDSSSKKPSTKPTITPTTTTTTTTNIPKILPGERMSDFAARVDQALPLSGISRKSASGTTLGKDPALRNLREQRQTKHERRLLRLQREWREEEVRIRERDEAEREEREAEEEEINEQWKAWEVEAGVTKKKKAATTTAGAKSKKKKKKGKKGKKGKAGAGGGEDVDSQSDDGDDGDDDDPWAKLNQKAKAVRAINPLEQVQAPPMQLVKPKEKFKVRGMGGAKVNVVDIPAAAGSLRRREELAGQRQSIVDEYRRIMAEKRG
ncbi:hypothetical protein FQN50_001020 [Emmonsiellopsis sp. PD_5]|nr:hypothetical protein FQN50_001020 [Emmonsiellopsis sp. PD_5]